MKEQKLVLASASPRRRELMSMFGFPYTCQSADIDEHVHTGETAQVSVQRLAREKNIAVQADALILPRIRLYV